MVSMILQLCANVLCVGINGCGYSRRSMAVIKIVDSKVVSVTGFAFDGIVIVSLFVRDY